MSSQWVREVWRLRRAEIDGEAGMTGLTLDLQQWGIGEVEIT
jgi:hypothetical protein